MKKIPTLFQRETTGQHLVRNEITPGCEWVANGEGTATRKYDGTCVKVALHGQLFKRREVKKGDSPPPGFEPAQDRDEITGDWPGWVPANSEAPEDKWLFEAMANWRGAHKGENPPEGTYELCGGAINANPEGLPLHILIPHGKFIIHGWPRDFEGLKRFLTRAEIEGIVWHHPDGRMAKIKKRDFGFKRKAVQNHNENHLAQDRRTKILWAVPSLFEGLFRAGAGYKVMDGLPADARIVAAGFDHYKKALWFHVESDTFEPVAEGGLLPVLQTPSFSTIEEPDQLKIDN